MNENDEPTDPLGSTMPGGDDFLPTDVFPPNKTGKRGSSPKTYRENTDQGADADQRTRTDYGGDQSWKKITDQGGDTPHTHRGQEKGQEEKQERPDPHQDQA